MIWLEAALPPRWPAAVQGPDGLIRIWLGFWNVDGPDAYAVITGTLTVTSRGQSVVRTGTLAYTFSKHGPEWKIDAQAWGRTS